MMSASVRICPHVVIYDLCMYIKIRDRSPFLRVSDDDKSLRRTSLKSLYTKTSDLHVQVYTWTEIGHITRTLVTMMTQSRHHLQQPGSIPDLEIPNGSKLSMHLKYISVHALKGLSRKRSLLMRMKDIECALETMRWRNPLSKSSSMYFHNKTHDVCHCKLNRSPTRRT